MTGKRTIGAVTAAVALVVAGLGSTSTAGAAGDAVVEPDAAEVTAVFEGEEIDLLARRGGSEMHCVVVESDLVECFASRTEAAAAHGGPTDADLELLRRDPPDPVDAKRAAGDGFAAGSTTALDAPGGGGTVAMSSGCSLTLYDNSYFGGATLTISSSGLVHTLSSYGWNQRASSWTEYGSCSVEFWDNYYWGGLQGYAGPFSASGDCCLWNNYWSTGGAIDNDISYARMN